MGKVKIRALKKSRKGSDVKSRKKTKKKSKISHKMMLKNLVG